MSTPKAIIRAPICIVHFPSCALPEPTLVIAPLKRPVSLRGEVPEWSNGAVSKTVEPSGSQGSNPCLSATNHKSLTAAPCWKDCEKFPALILITLLSTLTLYADQPAASLNEFHYFANAFAVFDLAKHKWSLPTHLTAVPLHNFERGVYVGCQIRFIDHH